MHRDEVRAAVAKQFAETLQQSEVKLTALPPDQLRVLVDAIGDSVFAVLESGKTKTMQRSMRRKSRPRRRCARPKLPCKAQRHQTRAKGGTTTG